MSLKWLMYKIIFIWVGLPECNLKVASCCKNRVQNKTVKQRLWKVLWAWPCVRRLRGYGTIVGDGSWQFLPHVGICFLILWAKRNIHYDTAWNASIDSLSPSFVINYSVLLLFACLFFKTTVFTSAFSLQTDIYLYYRIMSDLYNYIHFHCPFRSICQSILSWGKVGIGCAHCIDLSGKSFTRDCLETEVTGPCGDIGLGAPRFLQTT